MKWNEIKATLTVFALGASVTVSAQTVIIDQPDYNMAIQINAYSPVGQSFVATASNVDSIGLRIQNFNLDGYLGDRTVTVTLLSGYGFGGSVLAISTVDVAAIIGDVSTDWATEWLDFGFGVVPVAAGETYSFKVEDSTPRFGIQYHVGDAYSGGRAFTGISRPEDYGNDDLTFRVTTSVPEPSAFLMLLSGLVPLVAWRRARRRNA